MYAAIILPRHHAAAVGNDRTPLIATRRSDRAWIPLQAFEQLVSTPSYLLDRVADGLLTPRRENGGRYPVDAADGVELPVLDLQQQQTARGMEHDKIGVALPLTHRQFIPTQVFVFLVRLQPFGKTFLTRLIAGKPTVEGGNQAGRLEKTPISAIITETMIGQQY